MHRIFDQVQVDLNDQEVREGLIVARRQRLGRQQYRVRLSGGSAIWLQDCDIVNNITLKQEDIWTRGGSDGY